MDARAGKAWTERAHGELRRAGHRSGGARAAVVELLSRQDCCLSAQEIFDRLRRDGQQVGIASVYRALELLDEMSLVQRLDVASGPARYEPAMPDGHGHHHHMVCDSCGEVVAFTDERLESAIETVAGRVDFAVDAHEVVLHGCCRECG